MRTRLDYVVVGVHEAGGKCDDPSIEQAAASREGGTSHDKRQETVGNP